MIPSYTMNFIAIDTETGGTRSGKHALLSIGAAVSWDTEHTTFLRYCHPADGYTIEPEAARINGYTPDLWAQRGAIPLEHAMRDLADFLADAFRQRPHARMLAHNAGFDRAFLEESAVICGIRLPIRHAWRCSMDKMGTLIDRGLIPNGNAKLDRLGELSGQWEPNQRPPVHDALHDALACLRGYQWLLKKEKGAEDTLRDLYNISLTERRRLEDLFVKLGAWMDSEADWDECGEMANLISAERTRILAEKEKAEAP